MICCKFVEDRPLHRLPHFAAQLAADAQSTNINVSALWALQHFQPRALIQLIVFSPNEVNVLFACQCAARQLKCYMREHDPWLTPTLWFQEVC